MWHPWVRKPRQRIDTASLGSVDRFEGKLECFMVTRVRAELVVVGAEKGKSCGRARSGRQRR